MGHKRKRKPQASTKQRIECFMDWMKGMGLYGNFKKDKFKVHEQ